MKEKENAKANLLDDLFDVLTKTNFSEDFKINSITRAESIFDLSLSVSEENLVDYTKGSLQDKLKDYLNSNLENITVSYHCTPDEDNTPYILVRRKNPEEESKLYLVDQECTI